MRRGILREARFGMGLVVALVAVTGAVDPPLARAYVLFETADGTPVRWWSQTIPYAVAAEGAQDLPLEAVEGAVARSFAAWADVQCGAPGVPGLTFPYLGQVAGLRREFDPSGRENTNAIVFVDDGWESDARTIALTTLAYNQVTGEIGDADIEMNDQHFRFTVTDEPLATRTDLANVLTHEIGHLLGLDHSADPRATMAATSTYRETSKRVLADDDVAGLCALYGEGVGGPGGCHAAPGDRGALPFWLLASLAVLARMVQRRGGRRRALT